MLEVQASGEACGPVYNNTGCGPHGRGVCSVPIGRVERGGSDVAAVSWRLQLCFPLCGCHRLCERLRVRLPLRLQFWLFVACACGIVEVRVGCGTWGVLVLRVLLQPWRNVSVRPPGMAERQARWRGEAR